MTKFSIAIEGQKDWSPVMNLRLRLDDQQFSVTEKKPEVRKHPWQLAVASDGPSDKIFCCNRRSEKKNWQLEKSRDRESRGSSANDGRPT